MSYDRLLLTRSLCGVLCFSFLMGDAVFAQGLTGTKVPPVAQADSTPEISDEDSAKAIKRMWTDMRVAYNRQNFAEVCGRLDALRRLGQDISPSRVTAAYAYLRCSRYRANKGDIEGAESYLALSIQYGGERPEHDAVRGTLDRIHGMTALDKGDLTGALRKLEQANSRHKDPASNAEISAKLTDYAYQMHGKGDDVKSLAALDAALMFYPNNRQAELLRRDIWMWDYGMWLVIAFIVFGIAIYLVFRQWREVKIRETFDRGY